MTNYLLRGFSKEIKMNELSNTEFFSSSKIIYDQLPITRFFLRDQVYYYWIFIGFCLFFKVLLMPSLHIDIFQFQKSIELFSYYNYENHRDFVQFATELQKSANKTLYASSQISTKIFLEARCPVYSSAHSG